MTDLGRSRPAVTVAVCTFRRNDRMASLVRLVDRLAATEIPGGSVRVLIVDDSPQGGAADLADELREQSSITVDYFASAAADISVARNHALRLGAADSDFVACLDDDCVPNPGWLRELLRIADEQQADVVVGHRQFVAGPAAPSWLRNEPFLAENLRYTDGSVPDRGNTANMLVRSSWQQSSGVRFRAELGQLGGEDMVFFADASAVGANVRFAAESICNEPCDGRRATFRYQAWRQVWLGNNEAAINRSTREVSRRRLVARGAKRVAMGLAHPITRLMQRRSPQWRWSVALVGHGLGLMLGTAGIRLRHRG